MKTREFYIMKTNKGGEMEYFQIKNDKDKELYIFEQIDKIDSLIIDFTIAIMNGDKEWDYSARIFSKINDYTQNIKSVSENWKFFQQDKNKQELIKDYKNEIEELQQKISSLENE